MGRSIKLDPENLAETRRLYIDEDMTTTEIAKHLGLTASGVQRRLKRAGVAGQKKFDKTKFGYDLVYQLYVVDKLTGAQIGAKLGICQTRAFELLEHHGIPRRSAGRFTRNEIDRDLLHKLYVVDGLSVSRIVEILGISRPVITSQLREHSLVMPRGGRSRIRFDRDLLYQLYVTEGLSFGAIGLKLGVSGPTIAKLVREHGIPTRMRGGRPRLEIDRDLLYNQYYLHSRTAGEIAAMLGTTPWTIRHRLDEYGIPRRHRPTVASLDHEKLRELYVDRALPLARIITLLKANRKAILRELKKAGITLRPPRGSRSAP